MENNNVPKFIRSRDDSTLIAKKYENSFAKITLTQQVFDNPVIFTGAGSIYQDEAGQLMLKVYHVYSADYRERDLLPRGTTGEFIKKERLFRVHAIDMSGKEWITEDVRVKYNTKHPSIGMLIEVPIDEIKADITHKEKDEFSIDLMAIGEYDTPRSLWLKYPDGSTRRTKHIITHNGLEITTITDPACLYIRISGNNKYYNAGICDLVIEAINIAVGKRICILRSILLVNGIVTYKIKSTCFHNSKSLSQPMPTWLPQYGDNFTDFTVKYLNAFQKPLDVFYMNWRRINSASESLLDNVALIQSTVIESVLKEYFKQYGEPSNEEKALICNAMELMAASDNKLKTRIVDRIRDMGKQTAQNALRDLMKMDCIDGNMYKAWKRRHAMAHGAIISAGDPEDQQKALNESNAVLGLFYRLLFIHIGYDKQAYDYSQKGHPIISVNSLREVP